MIRRLVLGATSVLALGIAGAALDVSAEAGDIASAQPEPSHHWLSAANLSKRRHPLGASRATHERVLQRIARRVGGAGDKASAFGIPTEQPPGTDGEA
jgi:hypothetical protein